MAGEKKPELSQNVADALFILSRLSLPAPDRQVLIEELQRELRDERLAADATRSKRPRS